MTYRSLSPFPSTRITSLAVDVFRDQGTDFAHPQARSVEGHQDRTVVRPARCGEEPLHLGDAQDHRQPLTVTPRNGIRRTVTDDPTSRRKNGSPPRRPFGSNDQSSLDDEMIEERRISASPRPSATGGDEHHEPLDTPEVHPLRDRAHPPQPQIDRHPISQLLHERAPFRRRTRTSSVRRGTERIGGDGQWRSRVAIGARSVEVAAPRSPHRSCRGAASFKRGSVNSPV